MLNHSVKGMAFDTSFDVHINLDKCLFYLIIPRVAQNRTHRASVWGEKRPIVRKPRIMVGHIAILIIKRRAGKFQR